MSTGFLLSLSLRIRFKEMAVNVTQLVRIYNPRPADRRFVIFN